MLAAFLAELYCNLDVPFAEYGFTYSRRPNDDPPQARAQRMVLALAAGALLRIANA